MKNQNERLTIASRLLAGLLSNPNVVAYDASCGWCLVNADNAAIAGHAMKLADDLIDVSKPRAALMEKIGGAMKNILFDHPHEDVRTAMIRLLDVLTTFERSTGRHSVVIVKDELGGQCRALDGKPVPDDVPDDDLLQNFEIMCE